jgi:glycine reductase
MEKVRVMHYVNQFFAGIGGEEKADVPLDFREGPVGPGKRLQDLLGDSAKIVLTVYCGDNFFSEHHDQVLEKILQIAKERGVDIVVAGPAFNAGRYGFACVEVCHGVSTSLGLHGVAGMHIENPGIDGYRHYKDRKVFISPTSENIRGMEDALSSVARIISKLATKSVIGSPSEEGYVPRGFRVEEFVSKAGVERAVDMLLEKLADGPFVTEIPIESLETIPVAPPIADLASACLALATTTGIVPPGNPDGIKAYLNTQWRKYSIEELDSMKDGKWEVNHGGYNNTFMYGNPNYGVPLDASRGLEREGAFGRLYPYFYMTTGNVARISAMQAIGKEMALDMKAEGIDGVLLVSA